LLADLHRMLTRLRHTHPGLGVEVRQVRTEEVACGLRESLVDVALILAPGDSPAGSVTFGHPGARPAPEPARAPGDSAAEPVITPLAPEELVLATAPGGARSAPADLSALSLVDFPPGWAIREAVDLAFPHRRISLEVEDLAVAAGLVRAGLAACVLPASAAARFPELTVRRFERPVPWQLAAVHRAEAGPAVTAVLAQLG
jgi:hypothetical protein